ncbi:hypothetical protein F5141DRAFT_1065095 [Pisolithus sp. B1]|nr:hypothetical protein F5141DRAFT_1065095 [Pisolithus sp. B1]
MSRSIATYGVPTSFEYVIWFVHTGIGSNESSLRIKYITWWLTTPIMLFVLAQAGWFFIIIGMLINPNDNVATQIMFYSGIPNVVLVAIADVLIAVSLCVLLYERGSSSAIPRLVAIAELTTAIDVRTTGTWATGLDFLIGKSTLNSRQHLQSQSEGSLSGLRINAVHLVNPPKFPGVAVSSMNGTGMSEMAIIDITNGEKRMALRGEGEV